MVQYYTLSYFSIKCTHHKVIMQSNRFENLFFASSGLKDLLPDLLLVDASFCTDTCAKCIYDTYILSSGNLLLNIIVALQPYYT